MSEPSNRLVIFGASNIVSDLFDCAHARGLPVAKVVLHHAESTGPRDVPLRDRVAALAALGGPPPAIERMDAFVPRAGELYLLGPTTPTRAVLAAELETRFGLAFCTLVHPSAYVSPLARLSPGVFVGARSAIAAGAVLDEHVFVNRGVTIGHDTRIGPFSRIQPGANLGGLSSIGAAVTVGIGATLIERLEVGEHSLIAAGAVVTHDVPAMTLAGGSPARMRNSPQPEAGEALARWRALRSSA